MSGSVGAVALVLAESTGGIGRHVRSLVRGLTERGIRVDVYAPRGQRAGSISTAHRRHGHRGGDPGRPRPDLAGLNHLRRGLRDDAGRPGARARPAGRARGPAGPARTGRRWWSPGTWPPVPRSPPSGGAALLARAVARGGRPDARRSRPRWSRRPRRFGARDGAPVHGGRADRCRRPARARPRCGPSSACRATAPLVLSAGRLQPQKRYDVLVAAAARWRQRGPAPAVVIAGHRSGVPRPGRAGRR